MKKNFSTVLKDNTMIIVLVVVYLFFMWQTKGSMFLPIWTKAGKTDIPLVILINENSASSSEILAGGLQNLGRATLVGTTSYGKGIIQYVLPVDDSNKDGFQFTVAQYYLNDGTAVHKIGISPDVTVEMPEDLVGTYFELGNMDDPQLKRAWEIAREAQ